MPTNSTASGQSAQLPHRSLSRFPTLSSFASESEMWRDSDAAAGHDANTTSANIHRSTTDSASPSNLYASLLRRDNSSFQSEWRSRAASGITAGNKADQRRGEHGRAVPRVAASCSTGTASERGDAVTLATSSDHSQSSSSDALFRGTAAPTTTDKATHSKSSSRQSAPAGSPHPSLVSRSPPTAAPLTTTRTTTITTTTTAAAAASANVAHGFAQSHHDSSQRDAQASQCYSDAVSAAGPMQRQNAEVSFSTMVSATTATMSPTRMDSQVEEEWLNQVSGGRLGNGGGGGATKAEKGKTKHSTQQGGINKKKNDSANENTGNDNHNEASSSAMLSIATGAGGAPSSAGPSAAFTLLAGAPPPSGLRDPVTLLQLIPADLLLQPPDPAPAPYLLNVSKTTEESLSRSSGQRPTAERLAASGGAMGITPAGGPAAGAAQAADARGRQQAALTNDYRQAFSLLRCARTPASALSGSPGWEACRNFDPQHPPTPSTLYAALGRVMVELEQRHLAGEPAGPPPPPPPHLSTFPKQPKHARGRVRDDDTVPLCSLAGDLDAMQYEESQRSATLSSSQPVPSLAKSFLLSEVPPTDPCALPEASALTIPLLYFAAVVECPPDLRRYLLLSRTHVYLCDPSGDIAYCAAVQDIRQIVACAGNYMVWRFMPDVIVSSMIQREVREEKRPSADGAQLGNGVFASSFSGASAAGAGRGAGLASSSQQQQQQQQHLYSSSASTTPNSPLPAAAAAPRENRDEMSDWVFRIASVGGPRSATATAAAAAAAAAAGGGGVVAGAMPSTASAQDGLKAAHAHTGKTNVGLNVSSGAPATSPAAAAFATSQRDDGQAEERMQAVVFLLNVMCTLRTLPRLLLDTVVTSSVASPDNNNTTFSFQGSSATKTREEFYTSGPQDQKSSPRQRNGDHGGATAAFASAWSRPTSPPSRSTDRLDRLHVPGDRPSRVPLLLEGPAGRQTAVKFIEQYWTTRYDQLPPLLRPRRLSPASYLGGASAHTATATAAAAAAAAAVEGGVGAHVCYVESPLLFPPIPVLSLEVCLSAEDGVAEMLQCTREALDATGKPALNEFNSDPVFPTGGNTASTIRLKDLSSESAREKAQSALSPAAWRVLTQLMRKQSHSDESKSISNNSNSSTSTRGDGEKNSRGPRGRNSRSRRGQRSTRGHKDYPTSHDLSESARVREGSPLWCDENIPTTSLTTPVTPNAANTRVHSEEDDDAGRGEAGAASVAERGAEVEGNTGEIGAVESGVCSVTSARSSSSGRSSGGRTFERAAVASSVASAAASSRRGGARSSKRSSLKGSKAYTVDDLSQVREKSGAGSLSEEAGLQEHKKTVMNEVDTIREYPTSLKASIASMSSPSRSSSVVERTPPPTPPPLPAAHRDRPFDSSHGGHTHHATVNDKQQDEEEVEDAQKGTPPLFCRSLTSQHTSLTSITTIDAKCSGRDSDNMDSAPAGLSRRDTEHGTIDDKSSHTSSRAKLSHSVLKAITQARLRRPRSDDRAQTTEEVSDKAQFEGSPALIEKKAPERKEVNQAREVHAASRDAVVPFTPAGSPELLLHAPVRSGSPQHGKLSFFTSTSPSLNVVEAFERRIQHRPRRERLLLRGRYIEQLLQPPLRSSGYGSDPADATRWRENALPSTPSTLNEAGGVVATRPRVTEEYHHSKVLPLSPEDPERLVEDLRRQRVIAELLCIQRQESAAASAVLDDALQKRGNPSRLPEADEREAPPRSAPEGQLRPPPPPPPAGGIDVQGWRSAALNDLSRHPHHY